MQNSTKECDKDTEERTIYCDLNNFGDYIEYEDGTVLIDNFTSINYKENRG